MAAAGKDRVLAAAETVNAALTPLKPEERRRVLESAYSLWGVAGPIQSRQVVGPAEGATALVPAPSGSLPDAKGFMIQKQPKTDVERMTCLAYILTHHRRTPRFKTKDLERINSEARQPKIPNASVAADNATKGKAQLLSQAGGGFKQITPRGEALVDALPDREKVKAAVEKYPLARRFRRRRIREKSAS